VSGDGSARRSPSTRRAEAKRPASTHVGHSYGGAVITAAAPGNANVKGLVYVAAFAPDANEALGPVLQRFPDLGLGKALVPDAAGFLYIDPAKYPEVFAKGLPPTQARRVRDGAEADRRQRARRATHRRAGLEDGAVMVRRRDAGSRDQSGARALHGEADECTRD